MNTNKTVVIGSIIAILIIIIVPTTYKVIKEHNKKLYRSIESKITEAAKKCYLDNKCKEDKIYLKDLYELNYLEKVSNPVTKEYYNIDSYVIKNGNSFTFKEEN